MKPEPMLDSVLRALDGRRDRRVGNLADICRELKIDYSWMCKFANRRIGNPGVLTVQKLFDYLSEHGDISPPAPPPKTKH